MDRRRLAATLAAITVVTATTGCGFTDEDARKELSGRGIVGLEIVRQGKNHWSWTGTVAGEDCTGDLTLSGSRSSRSASFQKVCTPNAPVPVVKPACGPDHLDVCYAEGRAKIEAGDGKAGAALLEKGCTGGLAGACNNLGVALDHGSAGLAVDEARAVSLFERACALKSPIACVNRGLHHAREGKYDDAFPLYAAACGDDEPEGCYQAGWALRRGEGAKKDDAKAFVLFEKGCAKGDPGSCGAKGVLLVEGRGVAKDAAAGEKLLVDACDKGAGDACSNLANEIDDGAVPKDPARAHALRVKGCDVRFATACVGAGLDLDKGTGTAKSPEKAAELFTKACALRDSDGCRNSAIYLRDGVAGPKDPKKARELFDQACTLGEKRACTERDKLPKP